MYGKPFNPNRPFGTCMGDGRFAFEQDGQIYNALKQPVDGEGNLMPLEDGAPAAAATVTDTQPPATQPPAPTETDSIPEEPEAPDGSKPIDEDTPDDEKPFDILAWAQGDEALKATPWAKVKAEAAVLLGDTAPLPSKEAARKAILAHYGLPA
jgi:hypothetical protein